MKRLSLALISSVLLFACGAEQTNVVNISIDEELLQSIAGSQTTSETTATGSQRPAGGLPFDDKQPVDNVPANVQAEIFAAIDANAEALNSRNLQAFTNSLHPESQIASAMPRLFEILVQNETRYIILDKSLQAKAEEGAVVLVGRRTRDVKGTLNQTIRYTMRKHNGQWKVFFMAQDK